MKKKTYMSIGISLLSFCAQATSADSLERYIEEGLMHNPGLAARKAEWKAILQQGVAVSSLPHPSVSYGHFIDSVETRVGPQEQKIGVTQQLPWWGTLGQREGVVEAEATAAFYRYNAEALGVIFEIEKSVYEYDYLKKSIAITQENIDLVERFEAVAQSRLKAGSGSIAVLKAQLELSLLIDRLEHLKERRGPHSAQINAALNRPMDAVLPWPEGLNYSAQANISEIGSDWAMHSPSLKALETQVYKEQQQVGLAKKAGYPGMQVGLDYIGIGDAVDSNWADSGQDALMVRVGFTLPLWFGKTRAGIAEAEERVRSAQLHLQQAKNLLNLKMREAAYRLGDAQRKSLLYEATLIPQARQSVEVSEEAYRSGSASFLDLIDAQRMYLEFQLNVEQARRDAAIATAELHLLSGQSPYRSKYMNADQERALSL